MPVCRHCQSKYETATSPEGRALIWCQKCVPPTGTSVRLFNDDWRSARRSHARGSRSDEEVPARPVAVRTLWVRHVLSQAVQSVGVLAFGIAGSILLMGEAKAGGGSRGSAFVFGIASVGLGLMGLIYGGIYGKRALSHLLAGPPRPLPDADATVVRYFRYALDKLLDSDTGSLYMLPAYVSLSEEAKSAAGGYPGFVAYWKSVQIQIAIDSRQALRTDRPQPEDQGAQSATLNPTYAPVRVTRTSAANSSMSATYRVVLEASASTAGAPEARSVGISGDISLNCSSGLWFIQEGFWGAEVSPQISGTVRRGTKGSGPLTSL